MNFLKRRMFQEGGAATIDPDLFFIDKIKGEKKFINRDILLKNLVEDATGQTIVALVQVPTSEIEYSPKAQELLRQVVAQTQSGMSGVDPNRFRFGERLPGGLYYPETAGRVASLVGDYGAQAAEGLFNIGRGLFGQVGRGGATREDVGPIDIFPSERFPFDPERRGGVAKNADRAGLLREGIPQADLVTTLSRARVGDVITDFSEEIAEINEQPIEPAPKEISDVLEPNITAGLPEELPTFTPIITSRSEGQSFAPGTVGFEEQEARRLAYQKALIGVDEAGFPLPESRLLQDETITEALKELQPAELTVDIDKTEADSLMDTQDKFDGKFDPPKITLDKVNTKLTLGDKVRERLQAKPVSDATKGSFREIFGSDRFLDFIRNVGGELARTGQMGEGLALGAAKAAEERATRDLLAEQEQKKFDRELEIIKKAADAKGQERLEPAQLTALTKSVTTLSTNVKDYEGTEASIGIMNDAIALFDAAVENGVPITGLPGRLARFKDEAAAFLGIDNPNVSDATKITNYIEQVKQRSIREILNESGRTISNLDREIVDKVFGSLDLTGDPTEILKKLNNARSNLIRNNEDKARTIDSTYTILRQPEYQGVGIEALSPYISSILRIINADPSTATNANNTKNAFDSSINDISLNPDGKI